MKILRFVLPLLCLILAFSSATAQEVEDAGWPVEERCVGEAAKPPEGWTFPGAILMTGHYGVHAVSADVATPYVVAFLNKDQVVRDGLGVSPDGKWYATPIGAIRTIQEGVASFEINQIRVISTAKPKEIYTIPWKIDYVEAGSSLPTPTLIWWDKTHLIYMDEDNNFVKINPFTGGIENFQIDIVPRDIGSAFFQSPDWSRVLLKDNTHIQDQTWTLFDPFDASKQIQYFSFASFPEISWSPDSSQFVTESEVNDDSGEMVMFDRNGANPDVIFLEINSQRIRNTFNESMNIRWSPDGRYLAFITTTLNYPTVISLYIADMQQKKVIDTCIEPGDGLAWSPDGTQLALIDFYDYKRQRPVMVLDMATWALYTVAYHDGSVIGWRAADP